MKDVKRIGYKSYNQLVQFLLDPTFRKVVRIEKEKLNKVAKIVNCKKFYPFKIARECKEMISKFLYEKKLPSIWIEPLFNFIKEEEINPPLDSGIDLKIGSQMLSKTGDEILMIRHKDGRLPASESNLSIVISARVSIDRIIRFVKENADQIKYWQRNLGLPPYNETPWKKTDLAIKIIKMKDEKNRSFKQISETLAKEKEDEEDDKEYDYLIDENNIKTLYYRYKKFLKLP